MKPNESTTDSKDKNIGGMPEKAIKGMLKSQNTPEHLKRAWRKKLRSI